MPAKPIYSANEILKFAKDCEYDTYALICEQIRDDIELYEAEDLVIIINASMIIFIKTLLHSHLIKLKLK